MVKFKNLTAIKLSNIKLTHKILGMMLFLVLFYSFIIAWQEIKYINLQLNNMKQEMPDKINTLWQQLIKNTGMLYQASSTVIADIPLISNAYLMENRKILEQLVNKIQYDLFKRQDYPINIHFHKINPNPTSFLKLWDKENFGEDLSYRNAISYLINRQTSISGIDIDKDKLIITGISPIKFGDQLVGSVEIFSDIQLITNELSNLLNANILIYLNKNQKDKQQNFKLISKSYYKSNNINTNIEEVEKKILNTIDNEYLIKSNLNQIIQSQDDNLILYMPIFDFNNQNIGTLVAQVDITQINKEFYWNITQIILKGLIITSIILVCFYLLIQKNISQPLADLTNRIQELSIKELDLIKTIDTNYIRCSELTTCNRKDCIAYNYGGHCWTICGSFSKEKDCKIMNIQKIDCLQCHIFKENIKTELNQIIIFLNIFTLKIRSILKEIDIEIKGLTNNLALVNEFSKPSFDINLKNNIDIPEKLDYIIQNTNIITNNIDEIYNNWNKLQLNISSNYSSIKNNYNQLLNSTDKTLDNILTDINNMMEYFNIIEKQLNEINTAKGELKNNNDTNNKIDIKMQITQSLIQIKTLAEYLKKDITKYVDITAKNKEIFNQLITINNTFITELNNIAMIYQNHSKTLSNIVNNINSIKLESSLIIKTLQKFDNNMHKIHSYITQSQEVSMAIRKILTTFKLGN